MDDKAISIEIGKRLKLIRQSKGMSQKDVAQALGWSSQGSVSSYENGTRALSVVLLLRFCDVLDVSIEYFDVKRKLSLVSEVGQLSPCFTSS